MSLYSSKELPLNIYYDLDIVENSAGDIEFQNISFTDTRVNDLLKHPGAYQVGIVRFQIQTAGSLPVWIPVIESRTTNTNPDKTIYSFTLQYQTYEFQQYLIYESTDGPANPPVDNLGNFTTQNSSQTYYYVYTFQRIQDLLNKCLTQAYDGLQALYLAGTGNNLPGYPNKPFFEIDPTNYNFTLNADSTAFDLSVNPLNAIRIFMNSPMYTLLSNFPTYRYGIQGITNGKNYEFDIKNRITNLFIVSNTYTAIQIYSDGESNAGLFNPVKSIVFSTSLLPVLPTLVGAPRVFNSDESVAGGQSNSLKSPVLIDFVVPISSGNYYVPEIYYEPQGELRFSDIISDTQLNSIELSVYWKDAFGNLNPVKLQNKCSASVKLLFRRKDYWNYTLGNINSL